MIQKLTGRITICVEIVFTGLTCTSYVRCWVQVSSHTAEELYLRITTINQAKATAGKAVILNIGQGKIPSITLLSSPQLCPHIRDLLNLTHSRLCGNGNFHHARVFWEIELRAVVTTAEHGQFGFHKQCVGPQPRRHNTSPPPHKISVV